MLSRLSVHVIVVPFGQLGLGWVHIECLRAHTFGDRLTSRAWPELY